VAIATFEEHDEKTGVSIGYRAVPFAAGCPELYKRAAPMLQGRSHISLRDAMSELAQLSMRVMASVAGEIGREKDREEEKAKAEARKKNFADDSDSDDAQTPSRLAASTW
jgi:hypothetical protein